jgi:hypothetical protein
MGYPTSPTISDVKLVLNIDSADTSKDNILTRLLNGAFDFAERLTRRQFYLSTETRYFNGNGKGYLLVDSFQAGSISNLSLLNPDRTVWYTYAANEYVTFGVRPQEPIHYRIEIINYTTENPYRVIGPNPYVFPTGTSNVQMTANFGDWDAALLPAGLQNLIVDLVVAKYQRMRGIVGMSVGGESLSFTQSDLDQGQLNEFRQYSKPLSDIWPD